MTDGVGITTRPNFQGWYFGPQSVEAIACGESDEFITSGRFAACCPTGLTEACPIATVCAGNARTLNNGEVNSCGTAMSCVTITVYQTFPTGGQSASNIVCGENWSAISLYREIPATTTSTSSTSSTSTSSLSLTSVLPSQTSSTTPSPTTTSAPQSGSSQTWIAGAVIGPVAIIALLAFLIWFFRRRSKRAAAQAENVGTVDSPGPQMAMFHQPVDGQHPPWAKPGSPSTHQSQNWSQPSPQPPSELETQRSIAELGTYR